MTKPDKHFHMSGDYEKHSSSQKTIGMSAIERAVEIAKSELSGSKEVRVLDIACGPGNLTLELQRALTEGMPETTVHLAGLDVTKAHVDHLIESSRGQVKGIVGSFYDLPPEARGEDIIFSNEGLHWQAPYEMSGIIYSQLPAEERAHYETQALGNFKKSIKNIHDALKTGGLAVVQFGHEGQLQKLWGLISETLDEARFSAYKPKVNFPLYYPTLENIHSTLNEAGFTDENIDINAFNQDLTENTAENIAGFLRAFTQPQFSQFFSPDDLVAFYERIAQKLNAMDIDAFRKDQWHRTLISLKKSR